LVFNFNKLKLNKKKELFILINIFLIFKNLKIKIYFNVF
jgi:hypothetical protein